MNFMIKISLTEEERDYLYQFIKTGTKKARAIARANVLLLADEGHSNDEISVATKVHRQTIWRIKNRYLEEGLHSALKEKPRSGQPPKYGDIEKTEIIAMACTDPPKGRRRWTISLLTERMKRKKNFKTLNRESVRLILKKAKLNLG